MPVAYTNHIGRSSRDTHSGKSTAVSSLADLAATERHNNHDYTSADVEKMQSDINLDLKYLNRQYVIEDGELIEVEGHLDLAANVRKIYEAEFTEAVDEYNRKQLEAGHAERQISDYLAKISEDKQQEVAVEGLIQIGSLEDWQNMSLDDKLKIVPVLERTLLETLHELDKGGSRLVLAGASLHLNEGSPHIHYVGVPVQELQEAKRGLRKRVKKSAVFTKDSLGTGLQDNVRSKIEPLIEKTYGWTFEAKKTGRNEDRDKRTQVNEILQQQIEQNQAVLEEQERTIEEKRAKLNRLDDHIKAAWTLEEEARARTKAEEKRLEELTEAIQTIEDYEAVADKFDEEILNVEDKLDTYEEVSRLIPLEERRAAERLLDRMYRQLQKTIDWMNDMLPKIFGVEVKLRIPEFNRRSYSLADRIDSAQQKVDDRWYDRSRDRGERD